VEFDYYSNNEATKFAQKTDVSGTSVFCANLQKTVFLHKIPTHFWLNHFLRCYIGVVSVILIMILMASSSRFSIIIFTLALFYALLSDRNHSKNLLRALYWWSSQSTEFSFPVKMSCLFQFYRIVCSHRNSCKNIWLIVAILTPFNI
jgi:hypothetical protein